MQLNKGQQQAFDEIINFVSPQNNNYVHLLSGAAGVGKTTLCSVILEHLDNTFISYALTATTHKAVSVLDEMCEIHNDDAMTIHSLLNIGMKDCKQTGKQIYNQKYIPKLSYNLVIIDEMSMIDEELLDLIIKSCAKNRVKVLFIGDSYQLPPVNCDHIPVIMKGYNESILTEVMRQALDNPIIKLASEVRQVLDGGMFPPIKSHSIDNEGIFVLGKEQYSDAIKRFFDKDDIDKMKCTAFTNITVNNYARMIRKNLLGVTSDVPLEGECYITNEAITQNGEVIIPNNKNVQILSTRDDSRNGLEGLRIKVRYINTGDEFYLFTPSNQLEAKRLKDGLARKANAIKNKFERKVAWGEFFKVKNSMHDIRPSYSMTVHNSQGSTYDTVFIDLVDLCNRNNTPDKVARLLYVALTRASKQVIIYGDLTEMLKRYNTC